MSALATLLLSGCGEATYCTLIGCLSQVVVVLPTEYADVGGADKPVAEVCVDDACGTTELTVVEGAVQAAVQPPQKATDARPVTVRVTVTRGSRTVAEASTTVTLRRDAPNGEDCGPVCFTAGLTLTSDGRLVAG